MKHRKFIVIARDFYREHPPIKYEILACDNKDATERVMARDWIKEILDVQTEIRWNKYTAIKYWKMYSDTINESEITEEYLNTVPIR